jgi:Uma2 family endonuclease
MREVHSMREATRLVTAEELEHLPEEDGRCELVEGRLVRMSPVGYEHGRVVVRLASLLDQHARSRNLGVVLTEVGFTLRSQPDTVRAPDVAFLRQAKIPSAGPRGFWNGPPDLAVEVLSPDDRPADVLRKVDEYLTRGSELVLVVDTDQKTITVHRPSISQATLTSDQILDIGDVVSGFHCRVRDIFESSPRR